ncbi:tRNA1(Val) (adenine(37)-N6)-methyltransferase [Chryseobacterium potabilaquae]|uniref:tRNA1(Val) (adenine(37)-N6)-methyltransferase n=1 Tax=Chryseobacterium potabilaquae TaxID=2675057 RepID=A0A6N4X1R7_9FLAO|nr:methyltransferase [Chryseobacterium potabilaquae]CAA7194787.1 tRNA1(Val) (adenine(37)-N6)-methyltransferase [Chryseobacterium potabilaquae]
MKPFRFKQFEIRQSTHVFRVGTDGVLLGALASVQNASKVLEIGTGTGLITLMLAQRNSQADFLGIDINEEAVNLTKTNFNNSRFRLRLSNIFHDFKTFKTDVRFDLIVSNPPYFEESNSEKDKLARQTIELNFKELISGASKLLSDNGIFSVIIPVESGDSFVEIAKDNGLILNKKINIKGIENSKEKRLILEFSIFETILQVVDFVIEKSPRQYSDQYLELTKEFHVFGK